MDALGFEKAVVGGYDWGGRAACVVSALWPDRVTALVSGNSYNIQNIARAYEPAPAAQEAAYWYQYYFQSERGKRGLTENRRDIAKTLWSMWSPDWDFNDATFNRSAPSFDNPDFVDVVTHSYRHRYGLVPGDPAVAHIETQLTAQPPIAVPSVTIDGSTDGVGVLTAHHAKRFTGPYDYRVYEKAGHNLPQERPKEWAQAVLDARALAM
jgi:pimeloyl-ACP methyl ester carboxylesterase